MAFDFAVVAHAVLDIAVETKKKLMAMKKVTLLAIFGKREKPAVKKPHQLVLELDAIAQIPLFRTA